MLLKHSKNGTDNIFKVEQVRASVGEGGPGIEKCVVFEYWDKFGHYQTLEGGFVTVYGDNGGYIYFYELEPKK